LTDAVLNATWIIKHLEDKCRLASNPLKGTSVSRLWISPCQGQANRSAGTISKPAPNSQ